MGTLQHFSCGPKVYLLGGWTGQQLEAWQAFGLGACSSPEQLGRPNSDPGAGMQACCPGAKHTFFAVNKSKRSLYQTAVLSLRGADVGTRVDSTSAIHAGHMPQLNPQGRTIPGSSSGHGNTRAKCQPRGLSPAGGQREACSSLCHAEPLQTHLGEESPPLLVQLEISALISQCTPDPNSTLQFVRCSIHCVVITTEATTIILTIVIKKSLPEDLHRPFFVKTYRCDFLSSK
ncbi:PREDICTED: uncharacterized protein LOC105003442 [Bison bison bison]|uniref:Uncharacterized protein LOC105003442 n=1 Tax=Bison bison bison TaxID=43346 RepID=A0A6P3J663_BISBB|nr:PREDICTED: uncharacterized protein LOC105003442 [Bison bison bison]